MLEEQAGKDAEYAKITESLESLLKVKEAELRDAHNREAELEDAVSKVGSFQHLS